MKNKTSLFAFALLVYIVQISPSLAQTVWSSCSGRFQHFSGAKDLAIHAGVFQVDKTRSGDRLVREFTFWVRSNYGLRPMPRQQHCRSSPKKADALRKMQAEFNRTVQLKYLYDEVIIALWEGPEEN